MAWPGLAMVCMVNPMKVSRLALSELSGSLAIRSMKSVSSLGLKVVCSWSIVLDSWHVAVMEGVWDVAIEVAEEHDRASEADPMVVA